MNTWTPEQHERLEALWRNGATATTIALELGVTRSAVLGRLSRAGLQRKPFRGNAVHASRAKPPARTPRAPRSPVPSFSRMEATEPVEIAAPAAPRLIPLEDLAVGECRYPVDRPSGLVVFCGNPVVPGKSWCPGCYRTVFRPRGSPA